MHIIFSLTALLPLITSNLLIQKSLQASDWDCPPVKNNSCTNVSNYINCSGSNLTVQCSVQSCDPRSVGCSCRLGSFNWTNYSTLDICACGAQNQSCSCLSDLKDQDIQSFPVNRLMDIVGLISDMTTPIPPEIATEYLNVLDQAQMRISVMSSNISGQDLAAYGDTLLNVYDKMVSVLVEPTNNCSYKNVSLDKTEVRVLTVGPDLSSGKIPSVKTENASMDINIYNISRKIPSNSAGVTFMSFASMDKILKPEFFNSSNSMIKMSMMSTVISATFYINNTENKLTEPVNFTFKHISLHDSGRPFCVYWNMTEWTVDGCCVLDTNSSYTVCSCVHLSTFALIMQTSSTPAKDDHLMEVLNLVAVSVGLVFNSLALLTFAFCRWKPGVNNVARINLCISLLSAHLLFFLTQHFLTHIRPLQVLCGVLSGFLHFLFLSCFVWMFIEAVLLYICVKNLSQISSRQRAVLSSRFLIVIGYVIALVIVGVSVGLVPDGYGSDQCWIKVEKGFIWSFLGPVCLILAINSILFIRIIISLNSTLTNLNAKVSRMKQTKIMVFKTLAQFVVLGCPWILGFFTKDSKMMEILFLILNSQQGTFIFLIYCLLNNEVRQQYVKWMSALVPGLKSKPIKDAPKKH
ncbi:adhesion G protein-coupled receptor E1-like isoform X2 [Triplophysa rosa]|uniref:EGF-like module-containing mucin-like hormone receptor-like 1 n=1 Tax=Triplophysa rosa TaxID=992332 RepID=A0A9W8C7X6_TRIRA|nr:adhesion G protein-coupled receptor E1-like isoform X2 [Triplophysa rosa]KAI7810671.1 putative EGF-like module-containing mucin-like hormone receptor-like 1 [Triplophysa rosa]